jgi:hypothetical protein
MKRDEKGRRNCRRVGGIFDDWSPDGNWANDNLSPTEDDEPLDDDECHNWANNPIRKLFDNPVNSSHQSYIETPSFPCQPNDIKPNQSAVFPKTHRAQRHPNHGRG